MNGGTHIAVTSIQAVEHKCDISRFENRRFGDSLKLTKRFYNEYGDVQLNPKWLHYKCGSKNLGGVRGTSCYIWRHNRDGKPRQKFQGPAMTTANAAQPEESIY